MNQHETAIPAEAMALAQQGRLVEAIKLTRERTGMSLTEAKDAVDVYLRHPDEAAHSTGAARTGDPGKIPLQAILFLQEGRFIDAIKSTREALGLGLKEAKETVESYLERNPDIKARYTLASAGNSRRIAVKLGTIVVVIAVVVFVVLYVMGQV